MAEGLARRTPAQDSLAGQRGVEPVTVQGPGVTGARGFKPPKDTYGEQIAKQLSQWSNGVLSTAVKKQQDRSLMEGQMAYQQGKTFEDIEMGGDKWALEGFRQIDAQTTASSLLAAQREAIQQGEHELDPEGFRKSFMGRVDAMLEGVDPRTAELVREQMAQQMPILVSDHTAQHMRYLEGKNYESLERSIDVVSRDPTAGDQLVAFAMGGEGSPSAGLSDDRRRAATVDGIVRAFDQDNPYAYGQLASAGYMDQLTNAQLNKIEAAKKRFENRKRGEYDETRFNQLQELWTSVENGELSPSEAVERKATILAEHHIEITNAEAGEIYSKTQQVERTENRTAAIQFEEAVLRGDWQTAAKITEPIMVQVESGGDPNAVSPVGAKGTHQVMDYTNRDPGFGIRPAQNNSAAERARVGSDYWRTMVGGRAAHGVLKWEPGDLEAAAVAYNAGPGVANKWIASGRNDAMLPEETRNYKAKIVGGLKGWKAPTAGDRLALAQQSLADTRQRLAMDTYEQLEPQRAQLDMEFKSGDLSREDWLAGRRELEAQYGYERQMADVKHEVSLTKSVMEAIQQKAETAKNDQDKLRLEAANAEVEAARIEYENRLGDDGSANPAEIAAATKEFAERRNQIMQDYEIRPVDQCVGAATEESLRRTDEAMKAYEKRSAEDADISRAVSFGYLDKLAPNLRERAVKAEQQRIFSETSEAVATGRLTAEQADQAMATEMNAFYAQSGYVDPDASRIATSALMGELVGENGEANPLAVDVLEQYAELKSMNPAVANKLFDPEAMVRAEAILSRTANPSHFPEAVRNFALELKNSPLAQDTEEFMARADVQEARDREVVNFLEERSIGLLHAAWQGDAYMSQVFDSSMTAADRWTSREVRRTVRAEMGEELARLQRINPGIKPRDLAAKAAENVAARTTLINGDLMMLPFGEDFGQKFFGNRAQEFMHDGAINSAVFEYLRSDEGRELLTSNGASVPEDTEFGEYLPRWAQAVGDFAVGLVPFTDLNFEPGQSLGDTVMSGFSGTREFRTMLTPQGDVAIQVLNPNGSFSDAIPLPAERVGEMYMKKRRDRNMR